MSIKIIIAACRASPRSRKKISVVRSAFVEREEDYSEGLSVDPRVVSAFKRHLGVPDRKRQPEAVVKRQHAEKHLRDMFSGDVTRERFNPDFHALYCAKLLATAQAERRELIRRRIREGRPCRRETHYMNFRFSLFGEKLDLNKAFNNHRELRSDDHSTCQEVGRLLRNEGAKSVLFPSIRHKGGQNTCSFDQASVQAVGATSVTTVVLDSTHNSIERMFTGSVKNRM